MTGKSKTRLVRPIERQPMKEWLYEHLENREIPGLEWVNRDELVFQVKWCHGSRHGWSVKDSVLFEEWAKHSGRWNNGDPKRWKANFRCALNSLRYVEEVKGLSVKKGQHAFRVFRMLETPKTSDTAKQHKRRSVVKDDADYGHSRCSIESVTPVRTSPRVQKPTSSRYYDTANDLDTSMTEDEEEIDSEGYQTDVQTETYSEWNGDENFDIESPAISSSSSSAAEDTVGDFVTEEPQTANIPNFDKIVPGLFKLEFGKMHYLPRHNSGFKVEMLKTQEPITPPILYSFTQPSTVPTSSPATSLFLSSASLLTSIPSQKSSVTKQLAGILPDASITSTISYIPTQEMNCREIHMLPTNMQPIYYHATFPETPEASIGSPDGNSEHVIEVDMYEEEVIGCSPVSASNGVSSLSMTSARMNQSHIHEFPSTSDSNQPVILIVKNGDIFPLTPP